jgi:hypothetical protein
MGKLKVVAPAKTLMFWFEVVTMDELKNALKVLPNVHLTDGLDAYGSFIVTMINWRKYQIDSTIADRVTRLRRKRRGEEMLTSKSTSTSPPAARAATLQATRRLAGERQEAEPANGTDRDEADEAKVTYNSAGDPIKTWHDFPKPDPKDLMTPDEVKEWARKTKEQIKRVTAEPGITTG